MESLFRQVRQIRGNFSIADLFIINAVTVVVEFIVIEQAFGNFTDLSTTATELQRPGSAPDGGNRPGPAGLSAVQTILSVVSST